MEVEAAGLLRERMLIAMQDYRLKFLNEHLRAQIRTDEVTGLANRRAFDEALSQEWYRAMRYGRNISVVAVEIDFFNEFSECFGQLEADECLRRVADCVRDALRATDVVARIGRDEFKVLLPETDGRGAQIVAESLRELIEGLVIAHPASPLRKVTASLGIATSTAECREEP